MSKSSLISLVFGYATLGAALSLGIVSIRDNSRPRKKVTVVLLLATSLLLLAAIVTK